MTVALHWFRTDLRSEDNSGLLAAQSAGTVVGLYIATPAQWDQHDDAPIKRDFWRRNLLELEKALEQKGIPLLCFEVPLYRDIPALLEKLFAALEVTELHTNREYPVNEVQRDASIAMVCRKKSVQFHSYDDSVLIPPGAVLNKSGEPFKVFTPYSRAMRDVLHGADMDYARLRKQPQPVLPKLPKRKSIDELDFGAVKPAQKKAWEKLWPAGEKHAKHQLQQFCKERIKEYRTARDIPAIQGTSQISPYLAAGVVSIRQCWQTAGAYAEGDGVTVWQNELLWREFYKYVMWHFPHVCRFEPWRGDMVHVPWRHDKKEFQAWCEGKTGIPIVDAAMRQLLQTGWMHNRLRMITAMFLSKHLLIDWRWGERWFMQHLVDGDFSANNGGWQWSASTGTDAVPYFRVFNPVTQSARFDPDGTFIRRFVPELASLDEHSIHDPDLLRPDDYPAPIIELAFGRERALQSFKKP